MGEQIFLGGSSGSHLGHVVGCWLKWKTFDFFCLDRVTCGGGVSNTWRNTHHASLIMQRIIIIKVNVRVNKLNFNFLIESI